MRQPKIIAFDVFGTVVDWHGSIQQEVERMIPSIDGSAFANVWRAGYKPAMAEVRSGNLGWTKIDDLHRRILDRILPEFHVSLSEEQKRFLNLAWHRLAPWPDTIVGLTQLKSKYTITTLSNGNLGLLANMAKHAGLPWDLILSAEVFQHYKPDPEAYLGVADIFDVTPSEVMLVATHEDDLEAAQSCGLMTAYVHRPHEYGMKKTKIVGDLNRFDYQASDLIELAKQLSA
jgi:2-haloacid dehalogenase